MLFRGSIVMERKVIIFLDFDGVLHPVLCQPEKFFCRKQIFEDTIRDFKEVEIVISSSWRHQYEFEELLNFFSVDIQKLITGCTRSVDDSKAPNRFEEIMDYLIQNKITDRPWIAIDDSRNEFPEFCPNLVLCSPHKGFNEDSSLKLISLLRQT